MKAYGGVEALHDSWPQHQMEVSSQLHVPAALPPIPIGQEAGWVPEQV
jgi:hypothetical protein